MKLLITSGGTSEGIDRVRSITNHASGQLGKIIAETALSRGHEVTLVTSKTARKPAPHPKLQLVEITNVADLKERLEPLVQSHQALVHSMAVSDYTPVYMAGFKEVQKSPDLEHFFFKRNRENKISSQEDRQVLFLEKTPKIISLVKKWNPAIRLIGFKLLVDVSKEELFSVARQSLVTNQADYILANDLVDISVQGHRAYLVDQDREQLAETKAEIAQLILSVLEEDTHG